MTNTSWIITTTVTGCLAFLGYLITYTNNLRLSQRKDRLDRVNAQLGELYGPLFAMDHASFIAWQKFFDEYHEAPGKIFGKNPSEKTLKVWQLWMRTVFMPMNSRMNELILSKSHLLIEDHMPSCVLDLCAHVAAYQVVLARWEHDDYSEHRSFIEFPKEFHDYAMESFEMLKSEQSRLLREGALRSRFATTRKPPHKKGGKKVAALD